MLLFISAPSSVNVKWNAPRIVAYNRRSEGRRS